jgi:hypothetical protein
MSLCFITVSGHLPGLAPTPVAIIHMLQQASKVQLLHAGGHSSAGCGIILQGATSCYPAQRQQQSPAVALRPADRAPFPLSLQADDKNLT